MIITVEKHGRKESDGAAVANHLAKTENESAMIAEIGNSVIAETLPELFRIMAIYRDSSPLAKCALFHCTINPAKDHGDEKLLHASHRVRLEIDPEGTRPYAIVFHQKKRAEKGGSDRHAHLVLSNVDSRGVALDDRWTKIRCERVARELEFDLGENPLLGRHHKPVLKALRRTRPDVAAWLHNAFGDDPPRPLSAMSSGLRGLARNEGRSLPKAKAAVRSAWERADSIEKFRSNLSEVGLSIRAGTRPNVWIVVDSSGRLVGSCDRILKMPRAAFQNLMEKSFTKTEPLRKMENEQISTPPKNNNQIASRRPAARRLLVMLTVAARMRSLRSEFGKQEEPEMPAIANRVDIWGIGQLPKPR